MPTRVQLPDGSIGEFPDGMEQSAIEGVLQKQFGAPKPPVAGLPAGQDLPSVPKPSTDMKPIGVTEAVLHSKNKALNNLGPAAAFNGVVGMGEGVKNLVTHPIESAKSMATSSAMTMSPNGYPSIGPSSPGQQSNRDALEKSITAPDSPVMNQGRAIASQAMEHPANFAGQVAGPALLTHGLEKLLPMGAEPLRAGAGTLNDAIINTPAKAARYGAEPGRELARSGIVGSSPARLSARLQEEIPVMSAEHRAIVANAPKGTMINTGPILRQPFDDAVAGATDPVTGAGGSAPVKAAIRTRGELTNVTDPQTGRLTSNLRNPHMTPLEATQLKSNIYGRTNYDNPSRFALSNEGLKGAAHGLKEAVETAVPESVESGQRLHNMMTAKDVLEPQARGQLLPTTKSGVIGRLATGAGTRAARGMYSLGDLLDTPVPSSFKKSFPIAASAASLKKKEDK